MTHVRAHVRSMVRPMVRGVIGSPFGGASFHDGISYSAETGRVVLKAPGAAPTITTLTSAFTFTCGNQSMFMGPAGLLVQSVTNTPRVEYDAAGNCLGLLMEASRTNLCLQSADFATTWAANSCSVSANATAAPDGTTTADKMVEAAASARHFFSQSITKAASSIQYAVSGFFKAAERTFGCIRVSDGPQTGDARVNINLSTGVLSSAVTSGVGFSGPSAVVTAFPSGWYRVTLVFTSSTDTTLRVEFGADTDNDPLALSYVGDGVSGLHLWGVQVEAAAFPSSYIPTTTVSVARTACSAIRTLGSEFSATAGTVVVAGRASGGQDAALAQFNWNLNDTTNSNRIFLARVAASDTARFNVSVAGVGQGPLDGTFISSAAFKSAVAYAANDLASSFNGAAVTTDATASLPTLTRLELGAELSVNQSNAHIRRFDYYPTRLSNAFLQSASA